MSSAGESVRVAPVESPLARARRFLGEEIWRTRPDRDLGTRVAVVAARSLIAIGRSFINGERNLQAGMLTYTTLGSIVPFLAVSFAIVAAFGGLKDIQDEALALVFRYLTPATADVVAEQIREVIGRVRVGPMGGLGLLFTALAAIGMLGQVEAAFNRIWEAPRGRPWRQRLPLYWSVATVSPILLTSSIAVARYVPGTEWLAPLVLGWLAFAATYKLLPNRRVQVRWALLGAAVAGTLFQVVARAFTYYTSNVVDYSRVYGSLAAIPLFLLWLFVLWHVILAGAEVARANQDPRRYQRQSRALPQAPLQVALEVAVGCARRSLDGAHPLDLDDLADELVLPERDIDDVACRLARAGILTALGEYPERYYILARPPAAIRVVEIAEAALVADGTVARHAVADLSLDELVRTTRPPAR